MSTTDPDTTTEASTGPDHLTDTLIIGAGQAGLATAHLLTEAGRDCLVVDGSHRVGDNWRHQYDSLTLYSPNAWNSLPGLAFPGAAWDFPGKDEVGDYLEQYAEQLGLPVRLDTRVGHLGREGSGFRAETSTGAVHSQNVVIATGSFGRTPSVPDCAADLDPAILQLHSSQYRRPGQLREGPVLVVGAAHSGCDIALELAASRPTTLAGRDPGQIPVSWDSPGFRVAMSVLLQVQRHVMTRRTPVGRRQRQDVLAHGGPMLRVKRADLRDAGVTRTHARVVGTVGGQPQLDDGTVLEVANVIWATGFRHDYSWLDLPVLDETGWPREFRGVAQDVEGVFFCGLSYQYAFASMLLHGVGRDADYLVRRILARPVAVPTRRQLHPNREE
ncbi:flavin-containing monooxygenase [Ornithinimicrobium murale]|uniref:flavin-containing monooxygenase n=1 Tax=Ornithinimicrobium murale TaxID=1050153 RepID=UPI000E0D35A2|nr:NAD(P)-binding domain-containing protein [Ornithinimicrobium murale]